MKSRKNKLSTKPRFGIESLEERQMMAGDVHVALSGGNMYINEAANQVGQANAVQISQLTNGMIRVRGLLNQSGGQTLIDGATYRDYIASGNLYMNLGGGRDTVLMGRETAVTKFNDILINTAAPGVNDVNDYDSVNVERVTTRGSLQITTGSDIDLVNIYNTTVGDGYGSYDDLKVNTGEGSFGRVILSNVTTRGIADIRTGTGADVVDVYGSQIGDGIGIDNFNINTFAGADKVTFNAYASGITQVTGNLNVYTYQNSGENDNDVVDMRSTYTNGFISVGMGAGDDQLKMLGVFSASDILLSAGEGKDTFNLTEVRALDDVFAYMGAGDDTLNMEYVGADQLYADGEGGNDSVNRWNNAYIRDLVLRNWETINGIRQNYFVPFFTTSSLSLTKNY